MVPRAGRINASAYQLMSKMLQTLTLSYPDRLNQLGPTVQVLFTDFSKFENEDIDSSRSNSLASESENEHPHDNKIE